MHLWNLTRELGPFYAPDVGAQNDDGDACIDAVCQEDLRLAAGSATGDSVLNGEGALA